MKKKNYFKEEWLQDPDSKLWLQQMPVDNTNQNVNYVEEQQSNQILEHTECKKYIGLIESEKVF